MGKIMRNGVPYGGLCNKANIISYDNANSNISASTVQGAIDELVVLIHDSVEAAIESVISASY